MSSLTTNAVSPQTVTGIAAVTHDIESNVLRYCSLSASTVTGRKCQSTHSCCTAAPFTNGRCRPLQQFLSLLPKVCYVSAPRDSQQARATCNKGTLPCREGSLCRSYAPGDHGGLLQTDRTVQVRGTPASNLFAVCHCT